ncbi:hypothetical protein RE628_05275 [Paenibacillus sp. D2_2]|uniref:hypothetical protein n=1 Tax=Paenibacillus sp. D2_2 TaxID=3073092 RepID=UPI002815E474|nr:hypothetical protein [Paenibacillus sp. D2_2]WMT41864.1 hypothetical protein RE628_05275 [Paenibacillus sp. D2_2]
MAGTILEEDQGVDPGNYIVRGWNGLVVSPSGKTIKLPDNGYLLVPFAGSLVDDPEPVESQIIPFVIDTKAPVSKLNNPAIVVSKNVGTISGRVTSSLLMDLKGLFNSPLSDLIGVAAVYLDSNGEDQEIDGQLNDDGTFSINVPGDTRG